MGREGRDGTGRCEGWGTCLQALTHLVLMTTTRAAKLRGGGGASNGANGSPLLPPGLGVEGWCMEADAVDDSSGGGSGSDEGAGRFSRKRRAPFGSGEVMQDGGRRLAAGEVQEGGV